MGSLNSATHARKRNCHAGRRILRDAISEVPQHECHCDQQPPAGQPRVNRRVSAGAGQETPGPVRIHNVAAELSAAKESIGQHDLPGRIEEVGFHPDGQWQGQNVSNQKIDEGRDSREYEWRAAPRSCCLHAHVDPNLPVRRVFAQRRETACRTVSTPAAFEDTLSAPRQDTCGFSPSCMAGIELARTRSRSRTFGKAQSGKGR